MSKTIDLAPYGGLFRLDSKYLDSYLGVQPPWGFGALSWFTFRRTYSRQGETWQQTCQRVIEGMFSILKWRAKSMKMPWDEPRAQRQAQDAFWRMFNFKWLPPGRGLWMMGTDFVYEEGSAALNNCGFVSTKDFGDNPAAPFAWMFQMLMLGVGIGFDTKGAYQAHKVRIPKAKKPIHRPFVIPDTRQGWAKALELWIQGRLNGIVRIFDYSQIRPHGAPIKRFGGTASGPKPLQNMFAFLEISFEHAQERSGYIDSTLIVDIANIIGQCVVSGNVRRSAQIALGSPSDEAFLGLKDADKRPSHGENPLDAARAGKRPWYWASNNSLDVLDDTEPDYHYIGSRIAEDGEPGFFWSDQARNFGRMADGFNPMADPRVVGVNPCVEQSLENYELCCLVETFPAHHKSLEDYKCTLRIAYMYAKAVTCVPTHDERTNAVMRANARIGCSMSGVAQAMAKFGTGRFFRMCDEAYDYIQHLDEEYSRWLAAPRSIKMTSVKPSGTVSLLAGATPGCHDDHSPFSIRRIRVATTNPIWQHAQKCGYHAEPDTYAQNTMVIEFPVKTEGAVRAKADVSMWEQFSRAAKLQRYWADNQVSATITFNPEEAEQIGPALEHFSDQLKGISLLALDVSAYAQTPYETITRERYEELAARAEPNRLMRFDEVEHDHTELFCDGDACAVPLATEEP